MRKTLLLLLAVLMMPVLAMAQTNMALQKTQKTYANQTGSRTETRLFVPYEVIGQTLPASGNECYTVGWWFNLSAYCSSSTQTESHKKTVLARLCTPEHMNLNGSWLICVDTAGTISILGHGGENQGGAATVGILGDVEGASIALEQWYYMTFVVDNANSKAALYLDGELLKDWTLSKPLAYGGTEGWEDGEFFFADYGFSGMLDDVQFYNKALSADEVAAAELNPSAVSGLTALYKMEEATANQVNSAPDGTINAIYQNYTAGFWGSDGLGGYTLPSYASEWSEVETVPTLAEGREIVAVDANVMVYPLEEGGVFTVKNGEEVIESEATIATGTELTLSVDLEEGYTLIDFMAADPTTFEPIASFTNNTYTVTGDVVLMARVTNETHALTVVNEQNIPYTITLAGEEVTDLNNLLGGGANYQLTLDVPSDKVLNAVKLGNEELTAENGVYTLFIDKDETLTIDARAKANYTVTFAQTTGGTVGATYERVTGTGTISATVTDGMQLLEGTVVTLNSTPDSGYQFVKYLVNGAENAGSFTLTADTEISALFEEGLEYCTIDYTTTQTRHYVNTLTLSDGTNSVTVNGNGSSGTRAQYIDRTDNVLVTTAGSNIEVTLSAAGTWIHNYLYVDYGRDGVFDVDPSVEGLSGDLVSHTGYQYKNKHQTNEDTADPTTCSDGYALNDNEPWAHFPSFTLPANLTPGDYRVRYKMDWNSVDPCGRDDSRLYGMQGADNGIKKHGTQIIDFVIRIESEELAEPRTITVAAANEALGTVAIIDPATEGNSVSTTQKAVTVEATAAEGAAFMNWTVNDEVVSTDAVYTYVGESDVELVANFGYTVTYTVGTEGSAVFTIDGAGVTSGDVVAGGSELTITVTPETGKEAELTVNGVAVPLANNTATVEITENTEIAVAFVNAKYTFTLTVVGQGDVQIWNAGTKAKHPNEYDGAVRFNDGDEVAVESSLKVYLKPAEGWKLESATYDKGNGEAGAIDKMSEATAAGLEGYQFKALAKTAGNVIIAVTFTEDSTSAIEGIGIDPENGPVEYFNLQGVQVSGENLAPGFYIVRQGDKTAKILVK